MAPEDRVCERAVRNNSHGLIYIPSYPMACHHVSPAIFLFGLAAKHVFGTRPYHPEALWANQWNIFVQS